MVADTAKIQINHVKTLNRKMKSEYLYRDLTYKIRGAFFEVYNILGTGFKEDVYHKALKKEFESEQILFIEKKRLNIFYKGEKVGIYEPDFIVDEKIIIEIKAVFNMPSIFEKQLYYYLKGTKYKLGFLVNFGADKLDIRRRIYDTVRIGVNQNSGGGKC